MPFESLRFKDLFYPTLWKKNMLRYWPVWGAYLIYWIFAMPLQLMTRDMDDGSFVVRNIMRMATNDSLVMALIFGVLSAMAAFSYLYNNRSSGFLHALPVRREGLFITSYLSGLSFTLFPALLVFVATALAEVAVGYVDIRVLTQWLVCQVLFNVFFFSLATFCAMLTGNLVALPIFYGITNVLAMAVYSLISAVMQFTIYGFRSLHSTTLWEWLTPFDKLAREMQINVEDRWVEGMGYAFVYAFFGLILVGCALALYRRWHLERAGDIVAVSWIRPIFKYGVAMCGSVTLSMWAYAALGLDRFGPIVLYILLVGCGAVSYFIAEMLLQKSFRVLKAWKGCVAFSLCVVVAIVGLELDVVGYEKRVPQAEEVKMATIFISGMTPHDDASYMAVGGESSQDIALVTQIHQAVVDRKDDFAHIDSYKQHTYTSVTLANGRTTEVETQAIQRVTMDYELTDGSFINRSYQILVNSEELSNPDSPASLIEAVVNQSHELEEAYFNETRDSNLVYAAVRLENTDTEDKEWAALPIEFWDDLETAVRADLAAGRIGHRYLMDDEERYNTCYGSDIKLTYYEEATEENLAKYRGPQIYDYEYATPEAVGEDGITREIEVTIQTTATETLRVLEESGVVSTPYQYWLHGDSLEDREKDGY